MNKQARKRVYLVMTAVALVLFVGGFFVAYHSRHDTICADRKPPVAQLDQGMGYMEYRCHSGEVVNK